MHRGSRKHVLDWTGQPIFRNELLKLLSGIPVEIPADCRCMPCGAQAPAEARLETFGPAWMPGLPIWGDLLDWWLKHTRGANTPNWDIAVGCTIEGRPGLILVEAKANWPELNSGGKALDIRASEKSKDNHDHIGAAMTTGINAQMVMGNAVPARVAVQNEFAKLACADRLRRPA